MVLVKILKRKDAATLIVAIVIAGIISQLFAMTLLEPAAKLTGSDTFGPGGPGWQAQYLQPIVQALLQLIALELLARITIAINAMTKK